MNVGIREEIEPEVAKQLYIDIINAKDFVQLELLMMDNKYPPIFISEVLDGIAYEDPFLGYFLLFKCEPFPLEPKGLNRTMADAINIIKSKREEK
jgi:hypothetical protein